MLKPAEGKALPMPRRYLLEMLCDWRAVGAGRPESARTWYLENRERFVLHPRTRAELERLLD